ncbi:MAG: signal peptidase II [Christensenellales bacterium]
MLKQTLKNYFKNYWWKLVIIAVVLLADMLTKFFIVNEVSLIDGVLAITPTKNYGAGFSILTGQTWLLISFTLVFLVGIVIFDILFKRKSTLFGIATGLIVAGSFGNLIDRLAFGYVRDFIYLQFINFPVFNVADMALTFGVILLAIYILFFFDKKQSDKKVNNFIEISVKTEDNNKTENINKTNTINVANQIYNKTNAIDEFDNKTNATSKINNKTNESATDVNKKTN